MLQLIIEIFVYKTPEYKIYIDFNSKTSLIAHLPNSYLIMNT
jgi:hypothetical protein